MLAINNIEVVYDKVILVLKGVSLQIADGSITTLLGANGAGKTTTLKAISGVLRTERGEITKGSIEFNGERIDGLRAHQLPALGIAQVFEGRRVFEHLTTEENLGESQSGGLEVAATASPFEKVSVNASGNIYYNQIDASNLGYDTRQSAIDYVQEARLFSETKVTVPASVSRSRIYARSDDPRAP